MRKNQRFALCKKCGNIVSFIENKGTPLSCCGSEMIELVANTEEANTEKHLPDVTINGNEISVAIGSVLHPMEEAHHIQFIYVETELGGQYKSLKIGEEPRADFCFSNEKPIAVYEYCNLHGLWKTKLK